MRKPGRIPAIWGGLIITLLILIALAAPLLTAHPPDEMGTPYLPPSSDHWLGTNDVGQDIFSELIYGTRVSLFIGVVAAAVITGIGTTLALISGYVGGWVDHVITAIVNVAMALPTLPLTVLLIAFLTPGKWTLILAMSLTAWTGTARMLRTRVQQICQQPFIYTERAMGLSTPLILFKHILPNLKDMVLMRGALSIASAMLTESSLSFLGLGTPGEKSWGSILHYAFLRNSILRKQYWWYLPPIFCISLAVLGFMLVGYYAHQTE